MLTWELSAGVVTGLAAVGEDLWRRQVSNWIPLSALIAGLTIRTVESGWRGLGASLGGCILGFGVFLIFYLLGGMGGGDVKLMAGFGGLLGPDRIWTAAWSTAVIGGIMAAGFLLYLRCRKQDTRHLSIPYAPAIVAGSWLALVVRN